MRGSTPFFPCGKKQKGKGRKAQRIVVIRDSERHEKNGWAAGRGRLTLGYACCIRFGMCRCAVFCATGIARHETILFPKRNRHDLILASSILRVVVRQKDLVTCNFIEADRRSIFLMTVSPRAARFTNLIRLFQYSRAVIPRKSVTGSVGASRGPRTRTLDCSSTSHSARSTHQLAQVQTRPQVPVRRPFAC
jgi:hypothetical protein